MQDETRDFQEMRYGNSAINTQYYRKENMCTSALNKYQFCTLFFD